MYTLDSLRTYALRIEHFEESHECVLCLGCSFTNWLDYIEHDYPWQLRQILTEIPWIVNGGQSGSGTWYHLFLRKYIFTKFCPKAVIFQIMEPSRQISRCKKKYDYLKFNFKNYPIPAVLTYIRKLAYEVVKKAPFNPQTLEDEMLSIKKLRDLFDCPFIFLLNKYEYPYYDNYNLYYDELQKQFCSDPFVITNFQGKQYQAYSNDPHPNPLRARLTALKLAEVLEKLLNI